MGNHRKRRSARVRTGLIGATGALAVGATAVATGLVPGVGNGFLFGDPDGSSTKVRTDASADADTRGVELSAPDPAGASPDDQRSSSPSAERPEEKKSKKDAGAAKSDTDETGPSSGKDERPLAAKPSARPSSPSTPNRPSPAKPTRPSTPPSSGDSSAEGQVLNLVNQERAKAGCAPVRVDGKLAALARNHSKDMAERGFFSHTDPDGNSPWDRAKARGITNMGGENIARGQANAKAVMDGWMNSPGHRANILNCDFKTLGVGTHFAQGGPWWTQAFGF